MARYQCDDCGFVYDEAAGLPDGARVIRVRTKADLPAAWTDPAALSVSAVTGQGLPDLRLGEEAGAVGDGDSQQLAAFP